MMNKNSGTFLDTSELPPAHYIFNEASANAFLTLQVEGYEALGMLWNNLITAAPEIREYRDLQIGIVSVSNVVVLVSMTDGSMILKMPLHQDLDNVTVSPHGIWLIMETMLLKINKVNFAVASFVQLPDVINSLRIDKNEIEIEGVTGEIFKIKDG